MNKHNSKKKTLKFFHKIFVGNTIPRKIFLIYLYTIIIGIILLALPISLKDVNQYVKYNSNNEVSSYNFIDILFTSVSAFTDTGLVTLDISRTFSWFGQLVLLLLIQVGGLGIFALYWFIWNQIINSFLYKKYKKINSNKNINSNFQNSLLISSERGDARFSLTWKNIKYAIVFILIMELVFWLIYSLEFAFIPAYETTTLSSIMKIKDPNINVPFEYNDVYLNSDKLVDFYKDPKAIWVGLFQSIAAINNAGLDIIGNASMNSYRNDLGTILQYTTMCQIIIGGIGYHVIYDLIVKIKKRSKFRVSLFTKVSLISYFVILFIGLILILILEFALNFGIVQKLYRNPDNLFLPYKDIYFGKHTNWNIFTNLLFNVVSSRSAGFSTISYINISDQSKWVILILMFIGCSPNSTGGGVRTTTVALVIILFFSRLKGSKEINIFKKQIISKNVLDAFIVVVIGIILVVVFSIFASLFLNNYFLITELLFEFASAFGTAGLSSGVLGSITNTNSLQGVILCLLLSIIMIIGQLGIPSMITIFKKQVDNNNLVSYPKEEIRI